MKSSGKRSRLRFTCRLSCPTSTPYSSARSRSSMTCTPRTVRIRERIESTPVGSGRHSALPLRADAGMLSFFLAISFLFRLAAIRAPVPCRTPLRAHHTRNDSRFRDNFPEKSCKKIVKVRTAIPINGDSPQQNRLMRHRRGGGGDSPRAPCEPMQGWHHQGERWLRQSPLHRPAESSLT